MRDAGLLEQISRGVYRLADLPALGMPDLVAVAARVLRGVVCLISALAFHHLTNEVPHAVYLALPRGWKMPAVGQPPIRIFRFSAKALSKGIEEHEIERVADASVCARPTIASRTPMRPILGAFAAHVQREPASAAHLGATAASAPAAHERSQTTRECRCGLGATLQPPWQPHASRS
jgi:hypothetical protein